MFRKIISVFLLAAALIAPLTVFAAIETPIKNKQIIAQETSSASLINAPAKKIHTQDLNSQILLTAQVNLGDVESVSSKDGSQLEPLLTDVWLISLALFGFVMLSNRSGV